jgi:hypothetical protein
MNKQKRVDSRFEDTATTTAAVASTSPLVSKRQVNILFCGNIHSLTKNDIKNDNIFDFGFEETNRFIQEMG